jgi:hypothetical protein
MICADCFVLKHDSTFYALVSPLFYRKSLEGQWWSDFQNFLTDCRAAGQRTVTPILGRAGRSPYDEL